MRLIRIRLRQLLPRTVMPGHALPSLARPADSQRCTAVSSSGDRCWSRALPGADRCDLPAHVRCPVDGCQHEAAD